MLNWWYTSPMTLLVILNHDLWCNQCKKLLTLFYARYDCYFIKSWKIFYHISQEEECKKCLVCVTNIGDLIIKWKDMLINNLMKGTWLMGRDIIAWWKQLYS